MPFASTVVYGIFDEIQFEVSSYHSAANSGDNQGEFTLKSVCLVTAISHMVPPVHGFLSFVSVLYNPLHRIAVYDVRKLI